MKNFTSLLVILSISFATVAKDRPYKRLLRIYETNPSRCLKVSKRLMKIYPDNPVPYYFGSLVYRDKSKTHQQDKTRYMMLSKSIGYAMKFENFDDIDFEIRVGWETYIKELRADTDMLIEDLENVDLANLGERLEIKHQKMVDNREIILLVASDSHGPTITVPASGGSSAGSPTETAQNEPENSGNTEDAGSFEHPEVTISPEETHKQGYFGLATGREVTSSYNKIQERELMNLINEERKALLMQPLKWEEDLGRAARYHAYDMATQDYFFHESYDRVNGELVFAGSEIDRNAQFYNVKHIQAQNIASSCTNAETTFNQWLMLDEQYDVLFDETSKKVGIGIAYDPNSACGYYWVLVTARK